jgi:phasin family protein
MAAEKNTKSSGKDSPDIISPFDFAKLLGPYTFSGLDVSKVLERERKNIVALMEANKIAYQGWQEMLRKQREIFDFTMSQALAQTNKKGDVAARADLAREGFTEALEHMRELALIASKSQGEAFDVVRERIGENMKEWQAPKVESHKE